MLRQRFFYHVPVQRIPHTGTALQYRSTCSRLAVLLIHTHLNPVQCIGVSVYIVVPYCSLLDLDLDLRVHAGLTGLTAE